MRASSQDEETKAGSNEIVQKEEVHMKEPQDLKGGIT
jgi:hypothetical protein